MGMNRFTFLLPRHATGCGATSYHVHSYVADPPTCSHRRNRDSHQCIKNQHTQRATQHTRSITNSHSARSVGVIQIAPTQAPF